jgi:hypothetical protein
VQLIAGEIRLNGESSEDDVSGAAVLHIARRYIGQIFVSIEIFQKNRKIFIHAKTADLAACRLLVS